MPVTNNLLEIIMSLEIVKLAILLILAFYAIFALLIIRQVSLMSQVLITNISPIFKAVAIIHAGFAIGFIFLVYGIL
ncbi:hypothetical protein HY386_01550 [Candidatus Daviesbacteria bacterium]|nr:hypothetical protein [Candidatus Daviesbacteria bacterium]